MKKSLIIALILMLALPLWAWGAGNWEPNGFGYAPQLTTQGTTDYPPGFSPGHIGISRHPPRRTLTPPRDLMLI